MRAHLSVLLGLIMLAKAWGYYLGRFDLLTSDRGVVQGASYTDVNAQLPGAHVPRDRGGHLRGAVLRERPLSGRGACRSSRSVCCSSCRSCWERPTRRSSRRSASSPNEQQYEKPYIERNIAGTRRAFGLDAIRLEERPFQPVVTADDVEANASDDREHPPVAARRS